MASTKFDQNSKQWLMFRDLFQFVEYFWVIEDNKQYWEEMIKAADDFEQKYQSDKLFCAWIADFISQKELEFHEMKGDTYGEEGKTSGTM